MPDSFQKAVAWIADKAVEAIIFSGCLGAIIVAAWRFLVYANAQEVLLILFLTILATVSIAKIVSDWKHRGTGGRLNSAPIYMMAACVIVVSVLVLFVLNGGNSNSKTDEPALPPPSTQETVTAWIQELGLPAKPANPPDYADLSFQYELSLPQGRAQLYAHKNDPNNMVTVEGDVQISTKCYEKYTSPRSSSLNNIQRAMLSAGVSVLPGVWHDKRRLLFKSTLIVDPSRPAQKFLSQLQTISWAHRVAREMSNIVCEGAESGNG